jgi:hypothetical protein
MKTLTATLMALALVLGFAFLGTDTANAQLHGNGYNVGGFVDDDGDGFNDLAPDDDGDGIPNGQDPDYTRPQDGSGNQFGNRGGDNGGLFNYWYRNMFQWLRGGPVDPRGNGPDYGYGPGNGEGYDGEGPHDGSGYGPGEGDGDCDGDGPYGPGRP